jgi:hypothetical protein
MNAMPNIPGMYLTVSPGSKKVRVHDPLDDNDELLAAINKVADRAPAVRPSGQKFSAVPESVVDLDDDLLKTLLLEITRKVNHPTYKCLHPVGGAMIPTEKDLEAYPGYEIFDPWSNSSEKPRYVKDVPAWRAGLYARQP